MKSLALALLLSTTQALRYTYLQTDAEEGLYVIEEAHKSLEQRARAALYGATGKPEEKDDQQKDVSTKSEETQTKSSLSQTASKGVSKLEKKLKNLENEAADGLDDEKPEPKKAAAAQKKAKDPEAKKNVKKEEKIALAPKNSTSAAEIGMKTVSKKKAIEPSEAPVSEPKPKQHAAQAAYPRGTTVLRDDMGFDDMGSSMDSSHFIDSEYDDRGRRWDQRDFIPSRGFSRVDRLGEEVEEPYIKRVHQRPADNLDGIRSDLPLNQQGGSQFNPGLEFDESFEPYPRMPTRRGGYLRRHRREDPYYHHDSDGYYYEQPAYEDELSPNYPYPRRDWGGSWDQPYPRSGRFHNAKGMANHRNAYTKMLDS